MIVAVVGTVEWPDPAMVRRYVAALGPGMTVVTGDAEGPDAVAAAEAARRGLGLVVYRADWGRYGRAAGPVRNGLVVRSADAVVAFWAPQLSPRGSAGTADVIRKARALEKPVLTYRWLADGYCVAEPDPPLDDPLWASLPPPEAAWPPRTRRSA